APGYRPAAIPPPRPRRASPRWPPIGPGGPPHDRSARDATGRPRSSLGSPGESGSGLGGMHVPVDVHGNAIAADPHRFAGPLGLPEDADDTLQVKALILAAEADAGDLHRQVVAGDGRNP